VRTTLNIDDALLGRAKNQARARGLTLGAFVEEALQEKLTAAPRQRRVPVPVFTGGTGLVPGVDATSNRGLYEALGEE